MCVLLLLIVSFHLGYAIDTAHDVYLPCVSLVMLGVDLIPDLPASAPSVQLNVYLPTLAPIITFSYLLLVTSDDSSMITLRPGYRLVATPRRSDSYQEWCSWSIVHIPQLGDSPTTTPGILTAEL